MVSRKMHQTTVRFGLDLWEELEAEAGRVGVSVAQYVRDSALLRLAYTRGREGDPHFEAALASLDPRDAVAAGERAEREPGGPSRIQRLEAEIAAEPLKKPPDSPSGA